MKLIAPSYYKKFKCIADKCKNSCCVGWEIDVDAETDAFYQSVGGELGKRLAENIDRSGEIPHFKLCDGERCPFLNKNGLCDVITELGEGALCQICADHPRYRNFYSDRTEIGLGLCCEAAAELILYFPPALFCFDSIRSLSLPLVMKTDRQTGPQET